MQKNKSIRTKDGAWISRTIYAPEKSNHSVVIIGPSGLVNQEFYTVFAKYLTTHQYTVVTFDFRGIGTSTLAESSTNSTSTFVKWGLFDLDAIILNVKNKFPGHEIIYLGHQISGEIIGFAQASQFINRIVLISSGLSNWQIWPRSKRLLVWGVNYLSPFLSDKYINKWISYFPENNSALEVLKERNNLQFRGPILAYSFTDDRLISQKSVATLLQHFKNAEIKWYHLKPSEIGLRRVQHLGFFRPKLKNSLWSALLEWMNNPVLN